MNNNKIKQLKIYFYLNILIGCFLTLITSFGPIIYMIGTFVIYIIFQINFKRFSNRIRNERFDIFKKNELPIGIRKGYVLSNLSLLYKKEFETLNEEQYGEYQFVRIALILSFLSFILILPITLIFTYLSNFIK